MHLARIMVNDGQKQNAVAEKLGVSTRMVRYYLSSPETPSPKIPRASKLDPFKAFASSLLSDDPFYNLELLFDRLKKQGYTGKISILRDWAAKERKSLILKAARRFETEPGHQAQVDWKEAGIWLIDGQKVKVYAFVMLLGYSRRPFVYFTSSMKSPVLLACHIKAFQAFGGIPRQILYDNMKTAWIFNGQDWMVNPKLLELASCLGFEPKRCQVRRPQTKGKVERFIQTLGNNFLPWAREAGLDSLEKLNEKVNLWLAQQGEKVLRECLETRNDRFEAEKPFLLPFIPEAVPDLREVAVVTVGREGRITYETNRYSVPMKHLGQSLTLKIDRMAKTAELTDGQSFNRKMDLLPRGARLVCDQTADRSEFMQLWEKQNKPKTSQASPPPAPVVPVEVRHPRVYDQLLAQEWVAV